MNKKQLLVRLKFLTLILTVITINVVITPSQKVNSQVVNSGSDLPQKLRQKVEQFTVKIMGEEQGTGFLVEKKGNEYTVLTNKHTIEDENDDVRNINTYQVYTLNGKAYPVTKIKIFPDDDLALVYFQSSENLIVARKGNTSLLNRQDRLYLLGYPGKNKPPETPSYYSTLLVNKESPSATGVEKDLVLQIKAPSGMSGSSVFNDNGEVVAIYYKGIQGYDKTYAMSLDYVEQVSPIKINWDIVCGPSYNPNVPELVNEGHRQFRQGQYPAALNEYRQATELAPNCYEAWYNKAVTLVKLKAYKEAIDSFDQALKIEPNNYNTWCERGKVLVLLEKFTEAQDSYEKAILIQPNAPDISKDCETLLRYSRQ